MKDVIIIAHFCSDFDGNGNNRFNYIANLISDEADVELISTDFSHEKKIKRPPVEQINSYKVKSISEPSYKKNVSLKRFYSHYVFGKNLKNYLKKRKRPDVLYCAVPSLNAAYEAAKYAKANNVELVIDVQDLWPEAFKMIIDPPIFGRVIYIPMQRKADYIYRSANKIVAVSETYANRALIVNKKCDYANIIYIGTRLSDFDKYAIENKYAKPENEIWIGYVGTLGHSYDLKSVIDAMSIIKEFGFINVSFIVIGDGPLKDEFVKYAIKKNARVEFTGRLNYPKMVGMLISCDILVNPIKAGAAASIINKHGDYAASGKPVINTQECDEYRRLISDYNCGINCSVESPIEIAKAIKKLIVDKELRVQMGNNARLLAEKKFDRDKTYRNIIKLF